MCFVLKQYTPFNNQQKSLSCKMSKLLNEIRIVSAISDGFWLMHFLFCVQKTWCTCTVHSMYFHLLKVESPESLHVFFIFSGTETFSTENVSSDLDI